MAGTADVGAHPPALPPIAENIPAASTSPAERIADALGLRRTKPGEWRGRCPCHDSASGTSLVVWDAKDDGGEPKAGIHDFGGCDAARILGAAGLTLAHLYARTWDRPVLTAGVPAAKERPRSDRPPRPIGTIRHTLRNEVGEVVAVHARTTFDDGTKRVWWERPNGTQGLGGTKVADLPLYGVHEVNGAAEVVLCEGETARDALAGIGVAAVGTVTGAEGTPDEAALRPLLKIPRVRLWPDNDQPGRSHMDSIAARLVAMGHPDVRVIGWADVPPKADAADLIAGGGTIDDVRRLMAAAAAAGTVAAAELLDRVEVFLGRFVAYPSGYARTAHTLWIAHAHLMDAWESTPRLAFLSPEPASGKTRALEVTELVVPNPVESVNLSAAALFRKVGDGSDRATILYGEIDTVFGPKAKEHEEVRGLLNAGHRRGAVASRCVTRGKTIEVVDFPAYCAVALAGLGDLPDTILTRSVIVRMRRRAPGERVEPYRRRVHGPDGRELRDQLAAWANTVREAVRDAWPKLPAGIEDRDADVWEPLLAVADAAGGAWPGRARVAAVALVADSKESTPSLGVRLLADLRTVFGEADALSTEAILSALHALDEAPWAELVGGKPLNARGLAQRLRGYGVRSKSVRIGGATPKGYARADLADAWMRYLPPPAQESATSATGATGDADGVARTAAPEQAELVADVPLGHPAGAHNRPGGNGYGCLDCGAPLPAGAVYYCVRHGGGVAASGGGHHAD